MKLVGVNGIKIGQRSCLCRRQLNLNQNHDRLRTWPISFLRSESRLVGFDQFDPTSTPIPLIFKQPTAPSSWCVRSDLWPLLGTLLADKDHFSLDCHVFFFYKHPFAEEMNEEEKETIIISMPSFLSYPHPFPSLTKPLNSYSHANNNSILTSSNWGF